MTSSGGITCHKCKGSGRSERAVRLVRALCGHCHGTGKEPERIHVRTDRGVESRPNPRLKGFPIK